MVVKMAGLGHSFAGVAAYCLHDRREPGKAQPKSAERVELDRYPQPADEPGRPGGRGDGGHRGGGSGAQTPGGWVGPLRLRKSYSPVAQVLGWPPPPRGHERQPPPGLRCQNGVVRGVGAPQVDAPIARVASAGNARPPGDGMRRDVRPELRPGHHYRSGLAAKSGRTGSHGARGRS